MFLHNVFLHRPFKNFAFYSFSPLPSLTHIAVNWLSQKPGIHGLVGAFVLLFLLFFLTSQSFFNNHSAVLCSFFPKLSSSFVLYHINYLFACCASIAKVSVSKRDFGGPTSYHDRVCYIHICRNTYREWYTSIAYSSCYGLNSSAV